MLLPFFAILDENKDIIAGFRNEQEADDYMKDSGNTKVEAEIDTATIVYSSNEDDEEEENVEGD